MINRVSCVSIDLINADKPPASLAFLAGACEQTNKNYHCISLNSYFVSNLSQEDYISIYTSLKLDNTDFLLVVNPLLNSIVNEIKNFNPDIILVSVFSYMQYSLAVNFLKTVRKLLPDIKILAGGPGVGIGLDNISNGSKFLKQDLVDYYCLGEGDEVLLEFLQGNQDLLGINSKKYNTESWVPQIDDLDSKYVVPSYQNIPLHNYHNLENKSSAVFSLSTSRGCVRDCSFCDVGATWKKFRFRSGYNVAQEVLKHHREVGAVHFTIVDSLINGSLKSFADFNQEMIKVKQEHPTLDKFSYNGMFIVRDRSTHKEDLFRLMKQAGCESLAIGVETGSDRLRADMNKKFTNEDLDYHLEMSDKYGIRNNLFMFVGYPTETDEDFEQSLNMLDRYQKYLINDTIIGISHSGVFSILPNTPVYHQSQELGLALIHSFDDSRLNWINVKNPNLTVKKRIERDLALRQRALDLRYPIPYANRYLEYLKKIESNTVPISD